jgi:hypothetical protein
VKRKLEIFEWVAKQLEFRVKYRVETEFNPGFMGFEKKPEQNIDSILFPNTP